jgi:hypothetical protein
MEGDQSMNISRSAIRTLVLASCLTLVSAIAVWAQPPGGRMRFDPEQMFDRLDANGDGNITKEEFTQGAPPRRDTRPDQARPSDGANRFREAALNRLKEEMGSSDEEWTVLKPRVEKVMDLQREVRGGMGFRGAPDDEAPEAGALRTAIENKDASAEVIKEKMDAFRAAKKKQAEALEAARAQLREVVTARQEATLLLAGLLD